MKKILSIIALIIFVSFAFASGNVVPKCGTEISPLTMLEHTLDFVKSKFDVVDRTMPGSKVGSVVCFYKEIYLTAFNYIKGSPYIVSVSVGLKTDKSSYNTMVKSLQEKGGTIRKTLKNGVLMTITGFPTTVTYQNGILIITRYSKALSDIF